MTDEERTAILKEMEDAWQTLGEFVPIRREGEPIPDGENGRFSIQWWRGPRLLFRKGDRVTVVGYHAYGNAQQRIGPYVQELRKK